MSTVPQNFLGLSTKYSRYANARAVVLPIPYDGTTSFRPGARYGPAAILAASRELETFDLQLGRDPSEVGIATLTPLEPLVQPDAMIERVNRAARGPAGDGKFLVGIGGDHSVTLGLVQAALENGRFGVLQIDAHLDLRSEYGGTPYSHACVMRRIHEDLELPVVQVGIRSACEEELEYVEQNGLHPFYAWDCQEEFFIEKVLKILPKTVYITVDVDGFDPSVVGATGTPEPGGLRFYHVMQLIREVGRRCRIVGADVVELSPLGGHVASDVVAAKTVYRLIAAALG